MVEPLLPDGVSVGHFSDPVGRTGCTVLLCPAGGVAGVDVRGGAPGTFATDGLRPGTVIELAHGILLTGGSLFGLAAATGVIRYLEDRGHGAVFGTVPIPGVVGAVLFDLLEGDHKARPTAEDGYAACLCRHRRPGDRLCWCGHGRDGRQGRRCLPSGPRWPRVESARVGEALVSAVMVANSVGGIWDDERHDGSRHWPDGTQAQGCCLARTRRSAWWPPTRSSPRSRQTASRLSRTTVSPERCGPRTRCMTATRSSASRPAAPRSLRRDRSHRH